jgi:protein-tyrosine phosphatase
MKDTVKILFICHGNICRSVMAQFVMQDLVNKRGLAERYHIDSAATSREEIGNGPHYGVREILARKNVPVLVHRARQITPADYDAYDLLIGTDSANMRNMNRMLGGDPEGKMRLLLDYAGRPGQAIADPWYTDNFDETFDDVMAGCKGLLEQL